MAGQSRIVELASIIQTRTQLIDDFLKAHDLPTPSFSVDASPDLPLPESLIKSRDEILEASEEIKALMEGPMGHLTRLISPTARTVYLLN
jgi:hypothetical protein